MHTYARGFYFYFYFCFLTLNFCLFLRSTHAATLRNLCTRAETSAPIQHIHNEIKSLTQSVNEMLHSDPMVDKLDIMDPMVSYAKMVPAPHGNPLPLDHPSTWGLPLPGTIQSGYAQTPYSFPHLQTPVGLPSWMPINPIQFGPTAPPNIPGLGGPSQVFGVPQCANCEFFSPVPSTLRFGGYGYVNDENPYLAGPRFTPPHPYGLTDAKYQEV